MVKYGTADYRPDASSALEASQSTQASDDEEAEEIHTRPFIFRHSTVIARGWGLVTCIALWATTIDMLSNLDDYTYLPWYLLTLSMVVTFLELVWLINKCACCKDDGRCYCCCTIWRIFLWTDNWKKSFLYIFLAIPCFLAMNDPLAIVCGCMVLVLAAAYFIRSFRYSKCVRQHNRKTRLVVTRSPKASTVPQRVQTKPQQYTVTASLATQGMEPVQFNTENIEMENMENTGKEDVAADHSETGTTGHLHEV